MKNILINNKLQYTSPFLCMTYDAYHVNLMRIESLMQSYFCYIESINIFLSMAHIILIWKTNRGRKTMEQKRKKINDCKLQANKYRYNNHFTK